MPYRKWMGQQGHIYQSTALTYPQCRISISRKNRVYRFCSSHLYLTHKARDNAHRFGMNIRLFMAYSVMSHSVQTWDPNEQEELITFVTVWDPNRLMLMRCFWRLWHWLFQIVIDCKILNLLLRIYYFKLCYHNGGTQIPRSLIKSVLCWWRRNIYFVVVVEEKDLRANLGHQLSTLNDITMSGSSVNRPLPYRLANYDNAVVTLWDSMWESF